MSHFTLAFYAVHPQFPTEENTEACSNVRLKALLLLHNDGWAPVIRSPDPMLSQQHIVRAGCSEHVVPLPLSCIVLCSLTTPIFLTLSTVRAAGQLKIQC